MFLLLFLLLVSKDFFSREGEEILLISRRRFHCRVTPCHFRSKVYPTQTHERLSKDRRHRFSETLRPLKKAVLHFIDIFLCIQSIRHSSTRFIQLRNLFYDTFPRFSRSFPSILLPTSLFSFPAALFYDKHMHTSALKRNQRPI